MTRESNQTPTRQRSPLITREMAMQNVQTFDRTKFLDEKIFEFFPPPAGVEFDDVGGSLNEF